MFSIPNKFNFIHIPKTSGSSFTKLVHPYIKKGQSNARLDGWSWQETWHLPGDEQHSKIEPNNIKHLLGQDTITIVRNPFSRAVSFFNNFNRGRFKNFAEYCQNLPESSQELLDAPVSQYDFLQNKFKIPVKYYKFENNAHQNICKDYRIPYKRIEVVTGPHVEGAIDPKKHSNYYKNYYDEETKEIVAEIYKKDITAFNYTFGG